ncbi:MAG: hypothetical protein WCB19_04740, partial [Thermoplasmata archaeon]
MSERVLFLTASVGDSPGLTTVARALAGPGGAVAALTMASGTAAPSAPGVGRIYQVSASGFDAARGDHVAAAVVRGARAFEASVVLSG